VALVTWDESYSVNVRQCDEHHQRLFDLVNNLDDAIKAGRGEAITQQVVKELAAYTKFHFWAEERLMERTKFPDLAAHRAQHGQFVEKVAQLQKDLKAGKSDQASDIAQFLMDWLTKHIKQTDAQYSSHLNANGVF